MHWPLALLLSLLTLFQTFPAAAQVDDGLATVRLDGRALFRLGGTEDLEARLRARQIERQLLTVLETPQGISRARIAAAGENAASRQITMAGRVLMQVTREDAEANGMALDAQAREWASILETALAQASTRRTSERARFVTDVRASVDTAFARLLEAAISIVPRALAALLVIGVFWALAAGVRAVVRMISRRLIHDRTVENLIKQVSYYTVWLLGLIVAATAFGLEPGALATGLGLTSLALGFALKDILSNFVSGLLILTLRPFQLGDQIVIGETEGTVERIELRATQIRTYDGRRVLVPNADTFTSRVTNNTAAPVRRGQVVCYLGYDVELQKVLRVLEEATLRAEGVIAEPQPSVAIREMGQSELAFQVQFWCDSRRSDFMLTASRVRANLIDALRAAGVALPGPAVHQVVLREAEPAPDQALPRRRRSDEN
ncbi:mechanosensitive ion channel family protein [Stutzerimonas balearica]|mgnify:FL=1|uniref:mechanosensitive ion channel family protein n=1 Tax=Stutzerimonas balearica TaxID=74829 RepID=UPI000596E926|nr:mechanosensitive ion channel family protein [Stutzerimonas balearica]KIL03498.1 mechanosensitive ion channel protein MscS [Stutzerimonas stutzeri]MBS4150179.1 mechanosensitive ion channel family protein [Stutzerimonas balearica]MCF6758338.1 mechanosensitive ion channel family protein [Stutzerimonas balearica]MCZ4126894.1 mechanosensitive ion channel [Stutzerimonas balearica]